MLKFMLYTPAEKRGMLDGISLFFGALIGTNLGNVEGLPIGAYALLIALLAGTVVSLRIFSTTERRWQGYMHVGLYSIMVVHFLFMSKVSSKIDLADRQRLGVTLAIWTGAVLLAELVPTRELPDGTARVARPPSPIV